jgi:hypothetical protein
MKIIVTEGNLCDDKNTKVWTITMQDDSGEMFSFPTAYNSRYIAEKSAYMMDRMYFSTKYSIPFSKLNRKSMGTWYYLDGEYKEVELGESIVQFA